MASRPRLGDVVPQSLGFPGSGLIPTGRTRDGSWRPDRPFSSADGLRVTMRRAAGLTPKGILTVPLRFQVPPMGDFRRPYRFSWSTFDTVSGGQHSRPMGAQLLEVQIDTMLLDRLAADATSGVVIWDGAADPQRVINELRYIAGVDDARKGKAAPFRLTISQPIVWRDPLVSIVATLTSIEPSQSPGDVATERLSVSFLEYPELATGRQRRNLKEQRTHHLKASDDLYEIAKRYFHAASGWRKIAAANGIKGVSPGSEAELAAWAKRHHKTNLVIPPFELQGRAIGPSVEGLPG